MVSNYREIQPQGLPHVSQSSNFGYFSEHARFGYVGPEVGRTRLQYLGVDHYSQSLNPHSHAHAAPLSYPQAHAVPLSYPHANALTLPHSYPRPSPVPFAHGMREVIQRELEKEQIRQEIIMSEIIRRRELEAEVRRELMMERELALQRGSNGFPFGSPSVVELESPMRLPLMAARADGRSQEERITLSLVDGGRLDGGLEGGGLEPLPFQRGSADVRVSEVQPVIEGGKVKDKIIFLAKPNENISGTKRTASPVDASESPSDGNAKKKPKEEWSCALCQVSATTERILNEHLQGKKHKAKEAKLRAQNDGKKYSIGLIPKKASKATITVGPSTDKVKKVASESLPLVKTGNASSKTDVLVLPLSLENLKTDDLKKNEKPEVAKKVQKDKKNPKFWCAMCQVGAHSEKVLNNHQNGRKHKSRLNKCDKSCRVGLSDGKNGAANEPVCVIRPDDGLTKT